MSTYAIDSQRQEFVTTGIAEPVFDWIETPEGKRRPSEIQSHHPETGMPLWNVEVTYRSASFGRAYTATAMVSVGAPEEPKVSPYTTIIFDGLKVDIYTNRAGGFSERWSAETIKEHSSEAARKQAPGGSSTDSKSVA